MAAAQELQGGLERRARVSRELAESGGSRPPGSHVDENLGESWGKPLGNWNTEPVGPSRDATYLAPTAFSILLHSRPFLLPPYLSPLSLPVAMTSLFQGRRKQQRPVPIAVNDHGQ